MCRSPISPESVLRIFSSSRKEEPDVEMLNCAGDQTSPLSGGAARSVKWKTWSVSGGGGGMTRQREWQGVRARVGAGRESQGQGRRGVTRAPLSPAGTAAG